MDKVWCLSCQKGFESDSDRTDHFKSQLHGLNITRSLSGLLPINEHEYDRISSQLQESPKFPCELCDNRLFRTIELLERHQLSKSHRRKTVQTNRDTKTKCSIKECFLCGQVFDDPKSNYEHMNKTHGFEIYCVESVESLERFLEHLCVSPIQAANPLISVCLDSKIFDQNQCTVCGTRFHSSGAVISHMKSLGHFGTGQSIPQIYEDFYVEMETLSDEDEPTGEFGGDEPFQMVLPNQSVIGHKSLLRYYRQNLTQHCSSSMQLDVAEKPNSLNNKALDIFSRSHDKRIKMLRRSEIRAKKIIARRAVAVGVKSNKLNRFNRPQILL